MATPVALTIAGSDPSGGAGLQADLKVFHQFGVYGEAVVTLVTVQNTQRVSRIELMSPELVFEQIRAVVEDIPPAAAKTGALGSAEIVEIVAELASRFAFPLIVDPVMISKHGTRLLTAQAEEALKQKLLPYAALVTPNIPEAEALSGMQIRTEEDMRRAGDRILAFGCGAVLVKGGHLSGQPVDVLRGQGMEAAFAGSRVFTRHTHGTGCTYSAAITAARALGHSLPESILRARLYVQKAIETAPGFGSGNGPINHFATTSQT